MNETSISVDMANTARINANLANCNIDAHAPQQNVRRSVTHLIFVPWATRIAQGFFGYSEITQSSTTVLGGKDKTGSTHMIAF